MTVRQSWGKKEELACVGEIAIEEEERRPRERTSERATERASGRPFARSAIHRDILRCQRDVSRSHKSRD